MCLKYDIILMEHIQFVASQFQQEQLNLSPLDKLLMKRQQNNHFPVIHNSVPLNTESLTEPFSTEHFLLCEAEHSLTLGY